MSSWLAKATGIHISPKRAYVNRKELGNALKNISPVAGALTGGLGGVLLGGAGSALGRGIQPGANIGDILKSGISGAGVSKLGQSAIGGLKGAFAGGGGGAGASAATASPGAALGGAEELVGLPGGDIAGAQSMMSRGASALGSAARGVGSFAKNNPTAIGMGLQGIGQMQTAGTQNRLAAAQAARLEAETEEERRRNLALEPLRRALAGEFARPRPTIPTNPYGP